MPIKAVTFDLWDTMVDDDSDEPKRAAQGLRSKRDERRHLVWSALNEIAPTDLESVVLAYDTADAGFNLVWKELHINWTVEQRLRVVLNGLGRSLPADAFARLVEDTGGMEVEIPPDAIDGIGEALAELSKRYKLAVVSDAIVTPGTGLKAILEGHGLARHFSAFAFSDEVGHSKPHRSMFDSACRPTGRQPWTRSSTWATATTTTSRVPQALGAKAVLFTASRDVDKDTTSAEAVCASHRELPAIDRPPGRDLRGFVREDGSHGGEPAALSGGRRLFAKEGREDLQRRGRLDRRRALPARCSSSLHAGRGGESDIVCPADPDASAARAAPPSTDYDGIAWTGSSLTIFKPTIPR